MRRRIRRLLLRSALIVVVLGLLGPALPIGLMRVVPPVTSAFMLQSRSRDPATGRACERVDYRWVSRDSIARDLARAVLVAEDQRFFQHGGFDTRAIGDAVEEYARGGGLRGASTVSQQVAKNLFLWPGRSVVRKALEAWLTVWIEALWPKHRILEVHLNIAQFGPCLFGAEAASRRYFKVSAAQLSTEQAVRLAVVLPAPGRMLVDDPGPYAESRTREILRELQRPEGLSYLRDL